MSVIEGASVRVATMADGTLRLTVDVEPRHAQAAFALFGAPGQLIALAALKTGAQPAPEPPQPKDKPIAKWLALRCKEPEFQRWASRYGGFSLSTMDPPEERVAEWCREVCEVASRGDIDGDAEAETRFRARIYGPWGKHHTAATA